MAVKLWSRVLTPQRFEQVRVGLCAAVILIATTVLTGWVFNLPILKSVLPGLTTVKANTAFCLLASAVGLLLSGRVKASRFGQILLWALGGLMLIIAGLTLIEYDAHVRFGIDELAFADPDTTSRPYPGRMSPATALAFVALGSSLLLIAKGKTARTMSIAHALALAPAAIGYLSLTGYAYHVENLYNFGPYVSVAVLTAVGLAFLSGATILTKPEEGWGHAYIDRPIAQGILRRLVTFALVLPFAAGLVIVVGVRMGFYQPLFVPALFAVFAATLFGGMAIHAARSVRRGEDALLAARENIRRQAELAAASAQEAVEHRRIEEMKDEFIATVSHELRTPLTSIAGSLGLLKGGAGGVLPPRAARLVEIAESNSARLIRLINDILDIEKIRSGSVVFQTRPLQLKFLATMACEAMGGFAFDHHVDLSVGEIEPGLSIIADQDRLMQVMNNLLSNAIKVSAPGACVQISARVEGCCGRVMITDQGPGVPAEFHDKIFNRFAQADGSDGRNLGGSGLGLSIVKEVVERQGGAVGFTSKAGEGATFFFDLPLTDPQSEPDVGVLAAQPKILICEDDELVNEVLIDQLESLGYQAEGVFTANEARHALHMGDFWLLLLDIRLPDSDGVTLMRALRAVPATAAMPIIVMSGSDEFREEAQALGVIDWLSKPIRIDRLEQAVGAALPQGKAFAPLVLHVDGDVDLAELVRARLGGVGEIVSARSLQAARPLLVNRRPDLVILEIGLPDGSGEILLNDLRSLFPFGVPTILYTAREPDQPPSWPVQAVLIKSQTNLTALAKIAKRMLEEGSGDAPQAALH